MPDALVNSMRAVFSVDDPETVLRRYAENGGQASGPKRYPGYGEMWDIKDPDGIIWGLFKNSKRRSQWVKKSTALKR